MPGNPPPPPPGFTLDGPSMPPAPPPGFKLDAPAAPAPEPMYTDPMGAVMNTPAPPPPVAPAAPSAGPGRGMDPRRVYPEEPFTARGAAGNFFGGFNSALAKGVFAPEVFVRDMLGMDSRQARAAGEARALDTTPATNGWERGLRQAGGTVASSVPLIAGAPIAGAMGAGEALAPTSAQLAQSGVPGIIAGLKSIGSSALNYAGKHPVGSVLGDVESTAGSGFGQQRMQETHPEMGAAGDTLGAMLGGWLPTMINKYGVAALTSKAIKKGVETVVQHLPASEGTAARQAAERKAHVDWQNEEPGTPGYDRPVPVPEKRGYIGKLQDKAADVQAENARKSVQAEVDAQLNTPEAQANMTRDKELKATLGPNYQPTLAESSGAPDLLNKQRDFEDKMSGPKLVARREQQTRSAKTVEGFSNEAVPPVEGGRPTPDAVGPQKADADTRLGAAARDRALAADAPLAQGVAEGEAQMQADTARRFPERDADATLGQTAATTAKTGPAIREGYDEARVKANDRVEVNKKAVLDAAGGNTFESSGLNAGIKDDLAKLRRGDLLPNDTPPAVRKILGNTETAEAPKTGSDALLPSKAPAAPRYTAEDLMEAKKQLNEDIDGFYAGRRTSSDGDAIQKLKAVRNRVETELDNLGGPGSGTKEAVDKFNKHYKDEVVPNFRQDLGGDLAQTKPGGAPKIKDEDIPDRLTAPNAVTETAQNARVNPPGSDAHNATISADLDRIRKMPGAIKDGMIQPDAVESYLTSRNSVMEKDPARRKAVEATNPRATYDEVQRLNTERVATQDASLKKVLGGDATSALDDAIKTPAKMVEIKNRIGNDPEMSAALKRGTWERILAKGDGKAVEAYLDSPEGKRVFASVYGDDPKHLADIRTIIDANKTLEQSRLAKGSPPPNKTAGNMIQEVTGSSPASLISQANALGQGRTQPAYIFGTVASRLLNKYSKDQADRIMENIIFNPQVASQVAGAVKGGKLTPMQDSKLSAYLPMLPFTANRGDVQDTQPFEVTVHPRPNREKK